MSNLSLKEERAALKKMEYWFQANSRELPIQYKLVAALEEIESLRQQLKAREGEAPVAVFSGGKLKWQRPIAGEDITGPIELYTHPAPQVPDKLNYEDAPLYGNKAKWHYANGFNACREVMLKATQENNQ